MATATKTKKIHTQAAQPTAQQAAQQAAQPTQARRFRATQRQRQATRALARAEVNVQAAAAAAAATAAASASKSSDPHDPHLYRVVRRASESDWREASEPPARIGDFRAWLRGLEPGALVGVAGSAERDPIATWLRETNRDYGRVAVRAGETGAGPTIRAAHYVAYDRRGRRLGIGYLDYGLASALDWLDGAGLTSDGAPRLLNAGDVRLLLHEMSEAWPAPERPERLAATNDFTTPINRVGIGNHANHVNPAR